MTYVGFSIVRSKIRTVSYILSTNGMRQDYDTAFLPAHAWPLVSVVGEGKEKVSVGGPRNCFFGGWQTSSGSSARFAQSTKPSKT